jgi:putative nucleotidyltransferase-like protein
MRRRFRRQWLDTAGQMLIRAIRGERLDGSDFLAPEVLLDAARLHGVVLALHRAFPDSRVDPAIKAAAQRERAIALRLTAVAVDVSGWLREAGVSHAIVKGPAVAAAFPNNDRGFVDVDVLVDPQAMGKAIATLETHGTDVLEPVAWPRDDGVGQMPLGLPSGASIDLHADLIHHAQVRREFALRADALLSRSTTLSLLGTEVPVLDPEDTLTHVALHAMLSGGNRLAWLADLDALVRRGGIRWPVLLERARNARLGLVVGVMLERVATVLGTPVPPDVIRVLTQNGRVWSKLLAQFERVRPMAESHAGIVRGQILIRATRDSTATSLWALARLIWTEVILFVVRDPSHPWRQRLRDRRLPKTRRLRWTSR